MEARAFGRDASAELAANIAAHNRRTFGCRILVCGRDEVSTAILHRLTRILRLNAEVVLPETPPLFAIRERAPDLVLLDFSSDQRWAARVLHRIRVIHDKAALPLIGVLATSRPSEIARCLSAGANDYLVRPVDLD